MARKKEGGWRFVVGCKSRYDQPVVESSPRCVLARERFLVGTFFPAATSGRLARRTWYDGSPISPRAAGAAHRGSSTPRLSGRCFQYRSGAICCTRRSSPLIGIPRRSPRTRRLCSSAHSMVSRFISAYPSRRLQSQETCRRAALVEHESCIICTWLMLV